MIRLDSFTKPLMWFMALLLIAFVAGCSSGNDGVPKPAPTLPGAGTGTGAGHGPIPVIMGSIIGTTGLVTAPNYAILAKTTVTTTGATVIIGDLGLSPNKTASYAGFTISLHSTGCYSTATQVAAPGKLFASDNIGTPANCATPGLLTTAIGDMQTAYTDAAGRAADFTEIGAGNIGGMTLPPGTYKWSSGLLIPTDVTLSGTANDTWIFQIAGGITQASGTQVKLTGGAVAQNVFWQAADVVSIDTTALMQGVILAQTQINLKTGATVNGRLLAQSQVTLQANPITVK